MGEKGSTSVCLQGIYMRAEKQDTGGRNKENKEVDRKRQPTSSAGISIQRRDEIKGRNMGQSKTPQQTIILFFKYLALNKRSLRMTMRPRLLFGDNRDNRKGRN